ncbi:DUF739 family protein [Staphylococcus aureus]
MIYNFDYSLLYERMAEYRYSQSSLANAIPISRTSINHKLQGKNLFTQWEIKRICELLEIPPTKVGRYFLNKMYRKLYKCRNRRKLWNKSH